MQEEVSDDGESPVRTAILRQVGASWPSIQARLSATSDDILLSQRAGSVVVVRTGPQSKNGGAVSSPDLATRRVFLSKLCALVATISEGSGEFIASRFRKDVWPTMASHFDQIMQRQNQNLLEGTNTIRDAKKYLTSSSSQPTSVLDSERQMMTVMANALCRIFTVQEVGIKLTALIPIIGTVLLPLLDEDSSPDLQAATVEAIKAMISIDYDALYRALLHLSGRNFPVCPLLIDGTKEPIAVSAELVSKSDSIQMNSTTLASKASELLDYIDGLPEQVIH